MKVAMMSMDVETLYDAECLRRRGIKENKNFLMLEAVSEYIKLLDQFNIKGTFFVLYSTYIHIKDILDMASKNGHEIAIHGLTHRSPLDMTIEEFKAEIGEAKAKIENDLNITIKGYRAPCFGINDDLLNAIRELGFTYDSSSLHFSKAMNSGKADLSKFERIDDISFIQNGFVEVTPCRLKIMKKHYPVSGGAYMRLFPFRTSLYLLTKYIKDNNTYMFYCHPFEIINKRLPKLRGVPFNEKCYLSLHRSYFINNIRRMIEILKKNDFTFMTMNEYQLYLNEKRPN